MTERYSYLGRWNYSTNEPLPDASWISVDEAQTRWDEGERRFEVVPSPVSENAHPVPPWVLTCWGGGPQFTTTFLNPAGSIWRVIEYRHEQNRLFKNAVYDYVYPDETQRYREKEAQHKTHGIFRSDGTGVLTIDDRSQVTIDRLSMDQVDVTGNWMDVPAFGEWSQLTDPDYAASPA